MAAADIHVKTYPDAATFLDEAQPALEESGCAGDLLMGICLRMVHYPGRIEASPSFATVGDEQGLALAAALVPPWYLVVRGLRGDLDAAASAVAGALVHEDWPVPGVEGEAEAAAAVAARLAEATGRRPRLDRSQHLYVLRAAPDPVPVEGRLRLASEPDAPLIARWWHGSSLAAFGRADSAQDERSARRTLADGAV